MKTPSAAALIESQLSDEPVLGLYLHIAYHYLMATFTSQVGHGEVTPNMIGVLAILVQRPGLSQAGLARLIGIERVTAGITVSRAIAAGFVRRDRANKDSRSYALHVTPRGYEMLEKLRERIPRHESAMAVRLTLEERVRLRELLDKLVYG